MSEDQDNVLDHPTRSPPSRGGSDGGGFDDERLRAVEVGLAKLETKVDGLDQKVATKTDISNLKVWVLGGVLGAIGIAATIATIIVKAFFSG